jgi:large subunit ribosomal protein L28
MSKRCEICHKKTIIGSSITRRGLAKAKGGVGKKTTGISRRKFSPNLQKRRIVIAGKVKRVFICTRCIKSGKLRFVARQTHIPNN